MIRPRRYVPAVALAAAVAVVPRPAAAQAEYPVQIDSSPSGATVYIDSKDNGVVGDTPYRGALTAGKHTVILERPGYARSETAIKVRRTRKRQKFRVSLSELVVGTLAVSAPSGDSAVGADVLIDGETIGTVPDEFEIEVGPHQVEIVGADDAVYEEWVEVKQDQTIRVQASLGPVAGDGDADGDGDDDGDVPTPKLTKPAPRPGRATGDVATALLVFETGLDVGGRHFSYSGAMQSDNLRPYDADGVSGLRLGIELYPLAMDPTSLAAKFGIDAQFVRALGLVSSTGDDREVDTDWTQAYVGLRARHAVASTLLSGSVGYGMSRLEFEDPPPDVADEVPEAGYKFIRIGLDGRVGVGAVAVLGGADVLLVTEAGTSADRFQAASTTGFGGRAGVAVRVVDQVEARAVARYKIFNSTFTSAAGDEFVADGATDHQYGILLGGAFVY